IGNDHWFVFVCGVNSKVYLIEYGHDFKQRMEEWDIEMIIDWMLKMMTGEIGDRFYTDHKNRNHLIKMFVFPRKDFNEESVLKYLNSSEKNKDDPKGFWVQYLKHTKE